MNSADESGDHEQSEGETSDRKRESVRKPALSPPSVYYEDPGEGEARANAEDALSCHLAVAAKYPHIASEQLFG